MKKQLGPHSFELLERPIVHIEWRTAIEPEQLRSVMGAVHDATAPWGDFVMIHSLVGIDGISTESRKAAVEVGTDRSRGTAIVGASFTMRTISTMIVKVMSLRTPSDNPLTFHDNYEQALGWARERARVIARAAGNAS